MATQTAHIALLVANLGGGGAQRRMVDLANAFAARGHRVDLVLAEDGGVLAPRVAPEVQRVRLSSWRGRMPLARSAKRRRMRAALPGLVRYLEASAPDALMSSSDSVNVLAVLGHRRAGSSARLVLRVDNPIGRPAASGSPISRWRRLRRVRRLHPHADRLVAISQGVADDLLRQRAASPDRLVVIHNPVLDAGLLARAAEPPGHAWLEGPGPPVVLGVGRLVRQKGFATLLEAFARARARGPLRLVILGEGPLRGTLLRRASALGVAADVDLPGEHPNPPAAMARAAVLVVASRWEGFGSVIVEALASGCPVVSTDCPGGPAEILAGGRFGKLVPVGDPARMAGAVQEVLADPGDRAARQARARDFAVDDAADRYLEVLLG